MPTNDPFASIAKPLAKSNDPFAAIAKPLGDTGDIDMSKVAGANPSTPNPYASTAPIPTDLQANKQPSLLGPGGVGAAVYNSVRHAKNLVAGPYRAFTDAPRDEEEQRIKGTNDDSGTVANALGQFGLGAYRMALDPTVQAGKTAIEQAKKGNWVGPPSKSGVDIASGTNIGDAINSYDDKGNYQPSVASSVVDALPIVGPWNRGFQDEIHTQGLLPAVAGLATDVYGPKLGSKLLNAPESVRTFVRGNVDEPVSSGGPTARDRYESAKSLGINLDKADATNRTGLKMAKSVNQNSMFANGSYEKNRMANMDALNKATNQTLDNMYAGDREQGGSDIKNALIDNKNAIENNAHAIYDQLHSSLDKSPITDSGKLPNIASELLTKNKSEPLPSEADHRVNNILSDVRDMPPKQGILRFGVEGDGISDELPIFSGDLNYGDLTSAKSKIDAAIRDGGESISRKGIGQLKQLSSHIHELIVNPDSGLTTKEIADYKKAHAMTTDVGETYINPRSSYTDAINDYKTPEDLVKGIGAKAPSAVSEMQNRLGEAIQPVKRFTAQNALGTTKEEGQYNYRNFGSTLRKLPADYRAALFSPDENVRLKNIANTANALTTDENPSGTAKLGQKLGELEKYGTAGFGVGGALFAHPAAFVGAIAYPAGQYALGRIMNHTPSTEWLMAPNKAPIKVNPFIPPAYAAGVNADLNNRRRQNR